MTLVSRVLGLARDLLIARFLGTGVAADAFFAAFRVPNLFRRLLGEGALSAAFIPPFTARLEAGDREGARRLGASVLSLLALVSGTLSALGVALAPVLAFAFYPGFRSEPGKLALTGRLLAIMFPYVMLSALTGFGMAALNGLRRFWAAAFAPALLNICLVTVLLATGGAEALPVRLAWAVLVGGLLQVGLLWVELCRAGMLLWPGPGLSHPEVGRICLRILPAIPGLAVYQINIFVDSVCASFLGEGAVSALYYSNRLMQLPLALFGISVATAVFPSLSARAASGDEAGVERALGGGLRWSFFLMAPSTVGLAVLARPIVSVLFERGAFTAESTAATAPALRFYSLGLVFFSAVHILSRVYYARGDTASPVKVAVWAMLLNAAGDVVLMWPLAQGGLALATSLAAVLNVAVLIRRLPARLDLRRLAPGLGAMALCSAACGLVAAVLWRAAAPLGAPAALGVAIAGSVASYLGLASLMRLPEVDTVLVPWRGRGRE